MLASSIISEKKNGQGGGGGGGGGGGREREREREEGVVNTHILFICSTSCFIKLPVL